MFEATLRDRIDDVLATPTFLPRLRHRPSTALAKRIVGLLGRELPHDAAVLSSMVELRIDAWRAAGWPPPSQRAR